MSFLAVLCLTVLHALSADAVFEYTDCSKFLYVVLKILLLFQYEICFVRENKSDISCERSTWQTIHMKYQDFFLWKKKK